MVDAGDMRHAMVELGFLKPSEINSNRCESFIKILDPRKPGNLDFEEFVQAFLGQ